MFRGIGVRPQKRAFGWPGRFLMGAHTGTLTPLTTQDSNGMQTELEREKDRLKLLLDMTNTLVLNLEPRDLLRAISASIRQDIRCDSVGVWLPDSDRLVLRQLAQDFPERHGFSKENLTQPIAWAEAGNLFNTVKP